MDGIKAIVNQQFDFAKIICDAGLVPIIEPEVDKNAPEKEKCEEILKEEIKKRLDTWNSAFISTSGSMIGTKPASQIILAKSNC